MPCSAQGSVWGSGIAGIACAALAMVQPENHALWQVGPHDLPASPRLIAVCHPLIAVFQPLPMAMRPSLASALPAVQVAFVASFVSKLSDTVSSEIGKVSCAVKPSQSFRSQVGVADVLWFVGPLPSEALLQHGSISRGLGCGRRMERRLSSSRH